MSFWKNLGAAFLENSARYGEKQRTFANDVLERNGERLTEEQRRKAEAYANSTAPERARELAKNMRKKGD